MIHNGIKKYFNLLSYLSFSWLIVYFVFLLFSPDSFAQDSSSDSAFSSVMCNVYSVVTSTAGKSFAVFAVLSVGIGFFSGKVSWGLMVGASMGVALIFGAPSLIATLTGDNDFKCETGVTYVTTCELGECYSCPIGFSGLSCDRCAIGFDNPPDCDVCALEYTGSRCDECDGSAGYLRNSDTGECELGCGFSGVTGIRPDTAVEPGSGYINCNDTNFSSSQSIYYSCVKGNDITTVTEIVDGSSGAVGQCNVCSGNYEFDGSDCDQCLQGYTSDSGCRDCDSSAGWYEIYDTGICDLEATTDGSDFGVAGGQSIRPPQSWITCDSPNFQGGKTFVIEGGTIIERDGSCVCADGYDPDSSCVSCADGYRNLDDGNGGFACLKVCDIPASVKGVSATWVEVGSNSASCDQSGNYSGTLNYTCSESGVFNVTSPCDVTCSGSTPLTSGDDNIHVFTSDGSLTCPENMNVKVLVVAGGGGHGPAGGGGGGVVKANSYPLSAGQSVTITVGLGGNPRNRGGNSTFGTIISQGGGRGGFGTDNPANAQPGGDGGSGGGGFAPNQPSGGISTQTSQANSSSYHGSAGGSGGVVFGGKVQAGGGGGAGGAGESGTADANVARGGDGIASDITGVTKYYASGGRAIDDSATPVVEPEFLDNGSLNPKYSVYGKGSDGDVWSVSKTGGPGVVIIRYQSRNR